MDDEPLAARAASPLDPWPDLSPEMVVPIGDWLILPASPRDVAGVIALALPGAVWSVQRPQLVLDSPTLEVRVGDDTLSNLPIVARLRWRVEFAEPDQDARLLALPPPVPRFRGSRSPAIARLLLHAIASPPATAATRMRVATTESLLARFPEIGHLGAGLLDVVARTYGLPAPAPSVVAAPTTAATADQALPAAVASRLAAISSVPAGFEGLGAMCGMDLATTLEKCENLYRYKRVERRSWMGVAAMTGLSVRSAQRWLPRYEECLRRASSPEHAA